MIAFRAATSTIVLLGVGAAMLAPLAPAASAAGQTVNLTAAKSFSPATVSIAPGDTITWQWAGVKHNVTADAGQADTFASGDKTTGTFLHRFDTAGRFTYHCSLHSGMTGAVVVAAAGPGPDLTPPAVPTGLVATPSDGSVTVDWADSTAVDLDHYYLERQSGSVWSTIATPLTSVYVDNTVTNGATYSYRVSAVDISANMSAASAAVTATPAAAAPPPPSTGPVTRHVAIANYQFAPATLTVNSGDTVQWDWTGADQNHSVSSLGGLLDSFDSHLGALAAAILGPPLGNLFDHTFNQLGSFSYICRVHPDMTGTVNVVASGAPTVQTANPPATTPVTPPAQTAIAARTAKRFNIKIANFAFTPPKLSIARGDVVTWSWSGTDVNHSVTSKAGSAEKLESHPGLKIADITSGPAGGKYSHTFTHLGTFAYFCRVHPGMTGQITVGAPAAARVRIARVRRAGAALRLSYSLSKAASVRATVYRGAKRITAKTIAGHDGANSLRIALPPAARRAALRIVLRAGSAAAHTTVKASR